MINETILENILETAVVIIVKDLLSKYNVEFTKESRYVIDFKVNGYSFTGYPSLPFLDLSLLENPERLSLNLIIKDSKGEEVDCDIFRLGEELEEIVKEYSEK